MILLRSVKVKINNNEEVELCKQIAKMTHLREDEFKLSAIIRKSIDARKKPDIYFIYQAVISINSGNEKALLDKLLKHKVDAALYKPVIYNIEKSNVELPYRPVVIGAGPAGLFASYYLAQAGLKPILIERGKKIDERTNDVSKFWQDGRLNPASNVQFGEGGAGAFSDGKLNTLVKDKDGRNTYVLDTFIKFGASPTIRYDNKPHVGTDYLVGVVSGLREEIIRLGGEVKFNSTVTDFHINDNRLVEITINDNETIPVSDVILAIGHSARDTFKVLNDRRVPMQSKEFAVGLRVEHPQAYINHTQYGDINVKMPASPYKVATKLNNDRGVYSFCMCPGGYVVNASSEEGMLAVNGMSYFDRGSANANSAIIVSVGHNEYDMDDPMSAIEFQQSLERKAYELGDGCIPQQLLCDYRDNKPSLSYGGFDSVTKGSSKLTNLHSLFSDEITNSFLEGINQFDHKIPGFNRPDAILSGVESRTSSPVRISRDENCMSQIIGLYPCGEGAGYAGGIMSAAMDGLKCAEKLVERYKCN